MAALIFDASGIVKRYVNERGSAWVQALADPKAGHEIFLTRIARVEVIAAIARRGKGPMPAGVTASSILTQVRYDIAHQYNTLEIRRPCSPTRNAWPSFTPCAAMTRCNWRPRSSFTGPGEPPGLGVLTLISSDTDLNRGGIGSGDQGRRTRTPIPEFSPLA